MRRILTITFSLAALATAACASDSRPATTTPSNARVSPPAPAPLPARNTASAVAMDDSVRAHEATVTAAPPADVREDETKITNAVRRAIIADTSLSSSARGVQIVTAGTRVTLRGRVATTRERSAIEAWAKRTSGVTEVDDQIEVQSAQ